MSDSSRIADLKRRVQMDPASIAFAALAEEYRRLGRYEESVATCQVGLLRHPAYLSARVTLGRSLMELRRYEEAREQLEQVLRVAPENLAAIRGLAEIHAHQSELPGTPEPSAPAHPEQAAAGAEADDTPAPVSLHLAPIRPVRLSAAPDEHGPVSPPIDEPAPAQGESTVVESPLSGKRTTGPGLRLVAPRAPTESAPPPADTDNVMLKLEAFLTAILRARQSAAGGHPAGS